MLPFANLTWQHEAGLGGYSIQPSLSGTDILGPTVEINDPDRNVGRLDLGFSADGYLASGQSVLRSLQRPAVRQVTRTENALFFGARREFLRGRF